MFYNALIKRVSSSGEPLCVMHKLRSVWPVVSDERWKSIMRQNAKWGAQKRSMRLRVAIPNGIDETRFVYRGATQRSVIWHAQTTVRCTHFVVLVRRGRQTLPSATASNFVRTVRRALFALWAVQTPTRFALFAKRSSLLRRTASAWSDKRSANWRMRANWPTCQASPNWSGKFSKQTGKNSFDKRGHFRHWRPTSFWNDNDARRSWNLNLKNSAQKRRTKMASIRRRKIASKRTWKSPASHHHQIDNIRCKHYVDARIAAFLRRKVDAIERA